MSETHQAFLRRLEKSEAARWAVAQYLAARGHSVHLNPVHKAPTAAEQEEYRDDGDIDVGFVVEVKNSAYDWSSLETWRFPGFIVDRKDSFDRKKRKPLRYYIVNRNLTHAAIVLVKNFPSWTVGPAKNGPQGIEYLAYWSPLDQVEWIAL